MKINFIIQTWGEDLERVENFRFCLHRLKILCNFLNLNNISTSIYPFCFGNLKLTEDSYHSNLSALTYHKSFKTNYAIKQIVKNPALIQRYLRLYNIVNLLHHYF